MARCGGGEKVKGAAQETTPRVLFLTKEWHLSACHLNFALSQLAHLDLKWMQRAHRAWDGYGSVYGDLFVTRNTFSELAWPVEHYSNHVNLALQLKKTHEPVKLLSTFTLELMMHEI